MEEKGQHHAKCVAPQVSGTPIRSLEHSTYVLGLREKTCGIGSALLQLDGRESFPETTVDEPVHDQHNNAWNVEAENGAVQHEVWINDAAEKRVTGGVVPVVEPKRKCETETEHPAKGNQKADEATVLLCAVLKVVHNRVTSSNILKTGNKTA